MPSSRRARTPGRRLGRSATAALPTAEGPELASCASRRSRWQLDYAAAAPVDRRVRRRVDRTSARPPTPSTRPRPWALDAIDRIDLRVDRRGRPIDPGDAIGVVAAESTVVPEDGAEDEDELAGLGPDGADVTLGTRIGSRSLLDGCSRRRSTSTESASRPVEVLEARTARLAPRTADGPESGSRQSDLAEADSMLAERVLGPYRYGREPRRAGPGAGTTSSSCSRPRASGWPIRTTTLDLTRRGVPRSLPRPRADPPGRRRGDRAAAPGRARAVGAVPRARRPRRSARAARCGPTTSRSPPTASTASRGRAASSRSACSSSSAARRSAAGTRTSTTSRSTRSSSARRPCTRSATRWACSATA